MTQILTLDYFTAPTPSEASTRATRIPTHYLVASNRNFFSPKFLAKVKQRVPETLVQYLDSRKGKSSFLPYDINGYKITYGKKNKRTADLSKLVFNLHAQGLEIHMGEQLMTLEANGLHRVRLESLVRDSNSPQFAALKEYAIPTPNQNDYTTYCWLIRGNSKDSYAINAYMRAFALVHNNLALKKTKLVK